MPSWLEKDGADDRLRWNFGENSLLWNWKRTGKSTGQQRQFEVCRVITIDERRVEGGAFCDTQQLYGSGKDWPVVNFFQDMSVINWNSTTFSKLSDTITTRTDILKEQFSTIKKSRISSHICKSAEYSQCVARWKKLFEAQRDAVCPNSSGLGQPNPLRTWHSFQRDEAIADKGLIHPLCCNMRVQPSCTFIIHL